MKKRITQKKLLKHCNRFESCLVTNEGDKIIPLVNVISKGIEELRKTQEVVNVQYFKNEID